MSLLDNIESLAEGAEKEIAPVVEDVAKAVAPEVVQDAAPVVSAVEKAAAPALGKIFDSAVVDVRNELPELVSALGVNTADGTGVLHAVVSVVVSLLQAYGPAEIRSVLSGTTASAVATSAK